MKVERKKSINITTGLWRELQRAKADTGKALSVLMEEAWGSSRGTQTPAAPATVTTGTDPDHRMLDVILTKGTKGEILGIRSNLQAFNDAIELRALKASAVPHKKEGAG